MLSNPGAASIGLEEMDGSTSCASHIGGPDVRPPDEGELYVEQSEGAVVEAQSP